MKFIIAGLGNFGSSLGIKLVEEGHEVIGVDTNQNLVNLLQDRLTHTLVFDSTNELAIRELPLSDTDAVIISIGEDVGASITTTALFKKHSKNTRIIARSISAVHRTILEAMGIEEILNPEEEFAQQFANRLTVKGTLKSFVLDDNYEIAEFEVPKCYVGKTVQEVDIVTEWQVSLVTILSEEKKKNILGQEVPNRKVSGVVSGATVFKENDTLVLFGYMKSLRKMMQELADE